MSKLLLTAEHLRTLLEYNSETGEFKWLITKGPRAKIGSFAGSIRTDGYITIRIHGRAYKGHQLAWFIFYGVWPDGEPDHKNSNHADNRIDNLRDLSHASNMQNRRKARAGSKSGMLGVTILKSGRFVAQIMTNGKQKHIGVFDTAEEAHIAYINAKRIYHPSSTL